MSWLHLFGHSFAEDMEIDVIDNVVVVLHCLFGVSFFLLILNFLINVERYI